MYNLVCKKFKKVIYWRGSNNMSNFLNKKFTMNYMCRYFCIFSVLLNSFTYADELSSIAKIDNKTIQKQLAGLELSFNGNIGMYAIDTNSNKILSYRAEERFPVQSTMKFIGVAAFLKQSESNPDLLKENIKYTVKDIQSWHPISGKYIKTGMTLGEMAEAAITYSDNPSMNLIMKKFGGPKFTTDFARSIGNNSYNVIHYDGNDLNTDMNKLPDTATPHDMALSLQKVLLGDILTKANRTKLTAWMKDNTTGYKRIRSGVPIGWIVAEKTGSGDHGIANDIGIIWSPSCKPIILAIYTTQNKKNAQTREDIVASTTSIVLKQFEKYDKCFNSGN